MTTRGFCYLCSETYPEDTLPLRALTPEHTPFPACSDHAACDARAKARGRIKSLAAELGRVTPPGVCIVAVLLVAKKATPLDVVAQASRWMRFYEEDGAHARDYANDLAHARASGIVAHDRSADTLSAGERFEAIAASVRGSVNHLAAARDALTIVGFNP